MTALMVVACVSSLEYLSTHHDRVRVLGLGKMSYPGDGILAYDDAPDLRFVLLPLCAVATLFLMGSYVREE